jgi:hypothetical protein
MTLPLFFLLACNDKTSDSAGLEPTPGPHELDDDKDGLSNWDENNKYKTDPQNPDTDGDGYSDGNEINKLGTSPTNEFSHPYIGDFNVGACPSYPDKAEAHPTGSRAVETGGAGGSVPVALYLPGDIVKNFRLLDQYGEMVDLYSFCGKNVDLFFFQFNQLSGPTEYAALSCWIQDMKNVHSYYRDYGYELIVILTQNNDTELPTKDDVAAVASMLGFLNSPVLASNDETINSFHSWFEKDFHEPTLVHIGPDLKVLSVDNDDCAGVDRDPCPYMQKVVPEELCWNNPDPTCEPLDLPPLPNPPNCACPYPSCEAYEFLCKAAGYECAHTWED